MTEDRLPETPDEFEATLRASCAFMATGGVNYAFAEVDHAHTLKGVVWFKYNHSPGHQTIVLYDLHKLFSPDGIFNEEVGEKVLAAMERVSSRLRKIQ